MVLPPRLFAGEKEKFSFGGLTCSEDGGVVGVGAVQGSWVCVSEVSDESIRVGEAGRKGD